MFKLALLVIARVMECVKGELQTSRMDKQSLED